MALVAAVVMVAALGLWRFHRAVRRHARTDWGSAWLNWLDGLNRLFCRRFHRMAEVGLGLPAEGPAVVASNHVSGLDPLLLIAAAERPLRFIIAREQYVRPCLHWLFRAVGCIPVDRKGRPERAMREALAALRAGQVIAIFPQGRIQLPGDEPRPLKGGAVRLAQLAGCSVLPVKIRGVKGQGLILRSVFLRSRAVVEPLPAIRPDDGDYRALLRRLGSFLTA